MFGDVGQGALLLVTGLLMSRRAGPGKLRDFGALLAMCGAVAILSGWVYGSVFGIERAIQPPLGGWFEIDVKRTESIKPLLVATVGLGVLMMTLGVALNIVNRVRSRDYFALVIDKFGIVGFIFYWGVLGLGVRTLVWETGPPTTWEILALVVLPLLVLFFREPLHYLMTRRDRTQKAHLLSGLMEGFVDILETVSSYAANTVSFVRVGAFALAHAAVCVAIFAIERMVRDAPGGPLWSLLVVVLGNALVIGLEGLVVSIQAMRLEYYEFFSKFFSGQGKAYQPFKLS
jgi:V/A-type H+-transporting ATPase subunit I